MQNCHKPQVQHKLGKRCRGHCRLGRHKSGRNHKLVRRMLFSILKRGNANLAVLGRKTLQGERDEIKQEIHSEQLEIAGIPLLG